MTYTPNRYSTDCACEAFLTGWLAGMRNEGLPIRRSERDFFERRLAGVYDRGVRVGKAADLDRVAVLD